MQEGIKKLQKMAGKICISRIKTQRKCGKNLYFFAKQG